MDSPTSDQPRASGEETQRISSPTPTDLSDAMSSPRAGRKRTNDEMYKSGATGHGKKASVNQRPNTAPEKSQKALQSSQFARYGFHNDLFNSVQSFESAIGTLSTQASAATTVPDAPQTFVSQLQQLHDDLDRDYTKYMEELEDRDHKAHLELFDWDDLEDGYMKDMEPAIRVEQEIQAELARSYRNMLLWTQTTSDREAQRAIKRLRTRIAFVQTSEQKLAQKEAHYQKVLNAFQSTMALFGGL